MSNAKFFINEENMGENAHREQAEQMIQKLSELGWDVQYGDSINNRATEYERQIFDAAWAKYITAPKWAVLRADKFGPQAIPIEQRSQ